MPSVIWQASTTKRNAEAITQTNGLMVVDYDHLGSSANLNILRDKAISDPRVLTAFVSPRGDRFKVVFLTDVTDVSVYQTAYKILLDQLNKESVYGQFAADASVSNVSRCHFVPHDPDIFYNPNPEPMALDTIAKAIPLYNPVFRASDNYIVIVLDKILEFYRKNFVGRISVCNDYNQWISYGYALFNTFRDDPETAEHYFRQFSALSPKFEKMAEDDFQSFVDKISSSQKDLNSILLIIGEARKNGYYFEYHLKDLILDFKSGKFYEEGEIPPARFPLLKETQHLSDIQFDTGANLLFQSPTNSGKSEYVAKHASGKRILLVPTQDLAKQLAEKNSSPDNPIKAVYEGIKVTGDEGVLIGTYDSIYKLNRLENLNEYELWIDEAQNFILSTSNRFRNKQLTTIWESLPEFRRVVAMTGTVIDNDYLFTEQQGFQKVVINQENRPEKHLVLVETTDKKASILKRLIRDRLNVIFYNDKEEGGRLARYLTNIHNFKVQLFNRDTKEEDEHKLIISNRMVDKGVEILICTDSFKEGISLDNLDFEGIHVLGSVSWVDIEQLGSRPRRMTPPIYLYFNQDQKFYYKYFNLNAAIKQRIDEAQTLAKQLNARINAASGNSSIADVEREIKIIQEKEPRSTYHWIKLDDCEYTDNFLAAINDAYIQMKIAHYTNIQQLLIELAPYNYRFSVESDDVGKLTDYGLNKDKMTEAQADEFWQRFGKLTVEELYTIAKHLKDDDVEAAFRKYGTSKQGYRRFCDGLEVQLYFAKLKKEAKEPVLLKSMLTYFKVGNEYSRSDALLQLKKLQLDSHMFRGVSLESKRLVYFLRRYFDVEIVEGNGRRTSYKILSKNPTGFELDIPKIRKLAQVSPFPALEYPY
jgi:hypothetical protein